MYWTDLSWPEARAALDRGAIALWPVGATEAHGPHLPLGTDVLIAEETCRRAADPIRNDLALEVYLLPPLAFSVTEFAAPFPGTVSVRREVVLPYVREVVTAVAAQGFRAVCLVNAHLEPAHRHLLRDALEQARTDAPCPVLLADPCDRRWVPTLTEEFQSGACHAGRYETSLVMAANAEAVREDVRSGLEPCDIDLLAGMRNGAGSFAEMGANDAYFGDPRSASPGEGQWIYARLVDMVRTVVNEALEEPRT